MNKKLLLLALILGLALALSAFFACAGGDDDDDDSDDAADDTFPDDDSDDDDDVTDDTGIDDDDDALAPVLSNGYWDPAEFDWTATEDCLEANPCTALMWSVCDTDNNLAGGGQVFLYQAGTTSAAFSQLSFPWEDFFETMPDVSDCEAPVETGIGVYFSAAPTEPGDWVSAVDIEATDAEGNVSNKLLDVTFTIHYAP